MSDKQAAQHTEGPWQQNGSHIYGPEPTRRLICQMHYEGRDPEDRGNELVVLHAPEHLSQIAALKTQIAAKDEEIHRLREVLQKIWDEIRRSFVCANEEEAEDNTPPDATEIGRCSGDECIRCYVDELAEAALKGDK